VDPGRGDHRLDRGVLEPRDVHEVGDPARHPPQRSHGGDPRVGLVGHLRIDDREIARRLLGLGQRRAPSCAVTTW
jgi:hypothetical protein